MYQSCGSSFGTVDVRIRGSEINSERGQESGGRFEGKRAARCVVIVQFLQQGFLKISVEINSIGSKEIYLISFRSSQKIFNRDETILIS